MQTMRRNNHKLIMILIFMLVLPYASFAQSGDKKLQKSINEISVELSTKISQREKLISELNKISGFSKESRSWFREISHQEKQLDKLWKKYDSGGIHLMTRDKEVIKLKREIREKEKILRWTKKLLGNTIISSSGNACNSTNDLLKEFDRAAVRTKQINQKLVPLNKEISNLIKQHDQLSVAQKSDLRSQKQSFTELLKYYKKEYEYFNSIVNNQNMLVIINSRTREPTFTDKGIYFNLLVKKLKKYIKNDPAKISKLLKKYQNDTYKKTQAFKLSMMQVTLPQLEEKMKYLQKKLNTMKSNDARLEGCWLLTVGRSTSMVNVALGDDGYYRGMLVKNKLKYYKLYDTLFIVSREINDKFAVLFTGYENAFTKKGNPVTNDLTIKVDGDLMWYISDKEFRMHRCP